MLIVEKTSNGRTVVRLHKDWHPGRIGERVRTVNHPPRDARATNLLNRDDIADADLLQTALLRKGM